MGTKTCPKCYEGAVGPLCEKHRPDSPGVQLLKRWIAHNNEREWPALPLIQETLTFIDAAPPDGMTPTEPGARVEKRQSSDPIVEATLQLIRRAADRVAAEREPLERFVDLCRQAKLIWRHSMVPDWLINRVADLSAAAPSKTKETP